MNYIFSELQKVYLVNLEVKELPANERLAIHLKLSKQTMNSAEAWLSQAVWILGKFYEYPEIFQPIFHADADVLFQVRKR